MGAVFNILKKCYTRFQAIYEMTYADSVAKAAQNEAVHNILRITDTIVWNEINDLISPAVGGGCQSLTQSIQFWSNIGRCLQRGKSMR